MHTNTYASQRIDPRTSSDPARMPAGFLAIILNMGLMEMPHMHDYWSRSWVAEIPFFGNLMRRDRFMVIFWLLHVSHKREGSASRRMDEVRSVLDQLIPKFQSSYNPSQKISVDETIVGFRGRFVARQYIPSKPQRSH